MKVDPLSLARAHATEYDVPCVDARVSSIVRFCGVLWIVEYRIEVDTGGQGPAWASISGRTGRVIEFVFEPQGGVQYRPPLWGAYPGCDWLSGGWRQGNGEWYYHRWLDWYSRLAPDKKTAYRQRYPEPSWGNWPGFYTWIEAPIRRRCGELSGYSGDGHLDVR